MIAMLKPDCAQSSVGVGEGDGRFEGGSGGVDAYEELVREREESWHVSVGWYDESVRRERRVEVRREYIALS
jgi:hypothetical protein